MPACRLQVTKVRWRTRERWKVQLSPPALRRRRRRFLFYKMSVGAELGVALSQPLSHRDLQNRFEISEQMLFEGLRDRFRIVVRPAKRFRDHFIHQAQIEQILRGDLQGLSSFGRRRSRSEEHTSELQSLRHLVCRLLLEKKNKSEII